MARPQGAFGKARRRGRGIPVGHPPAHAIKMASTFLSFSSSGGW